MQRSVVGRPCVSLQSPHFAMQRKNGFGSGGCPGILPMMMVVQKILMYVSVRVQAYPKRLGVLRPMRRALCFGLTHRITKTTSSIKQ